MLRRTYFENDSSNDNVKINGEYLTALRANDRLQ